MALAVNFAAQDVPARGVHCPFGLAATILGACGSRDQPCRDAKSSTNSTGSGSGPESQRQRACPTCPAMRSRSLAAVMPRRACDCS